MSGTLQRQLPKVFSSYALKYAAVFLMLCDHTAFLVIRKGVFAPFTTVTAQGALLNFDAAPDYVEAVQQVYRLLDVLGHGAFPIFCFLLAEGFSHTHSKRRYLLTLLTFALVSEPIYDLVHYGVWYDFRLQNVLFTLSISAAMLWALDALTQRLAAKPIKRWTLTILVMAAAGCAAFLVRGEYVFLGTTAIALFWLLREKGLWRLLGLAPLCIASPWVLLALPILALYNGRRGQYGSKYFFYIFYPTHFLILMKIGQLCATFCG